MKSTASTKIRQGAVIAMPFFISDLNKSNDDKFFYLAGSILQIWAAL